LKDPARLISPQGFSAQTHVRKCCYPCPKRVSNPRFHLSSC